VKIAQRRRDLGRVESAALFRKTALFLQVEKQLRTERNTPETILPQRQLDGKR